ncbi:hypothetical protein SVAN01_05606 [Stagonosporopsis vannaccii]|nr:hypothetical protein SVAN01_05606 [Stagonosporopsis vannaccii]
MRTSTLLTAFLLSTTSLAAPTRTLARTHCRCILVSDTFNPLETPSAAHWTPAAWKPTDPAPSAASQHHDHVEECADLGPELDTFRHTNPDLYDSYMRDKIAANTVDDEEKPLPTEVLMNREPRPTSRPSERIVCYSEPETFTVYNDSCLTLWGLQIIVAITILACVAEGIHLGMRWFSSSPSNDPEHDVLSEKALRLPGAERLLLAIPAQVSEQDDVFSPGAEKKLMAYEATRYFVVKSSSGRREFIAYDSEDDDEANRPVM